MVLFGEPPCPFAGNQYGITPEWGVIVLPDIPDHISAVSFHEGISKTGMANRDNIALPDSPV